MFFDMLIADLRAKQQLYSENGNSVSLLRVCFTDGTLAVCLYRLMSGLQSVRLAPLAFGVHLVNKWICGCVIGVGAKFGPGFILIHPIGVVINSRVRGGSHVWLESGVVIGENRGQCPVLGDHIFVGSGAKIIGPVNVSSHTRVGANAVLLHDTKPHDTVVGIPARPVVKASSSNRSA